MLGRDLLIAIGGKAIAAQRTCSLNIKQDTIEVCSPVSGPWREYIPSTIGWEVSCNGLVCSPEHADELIDVLNSRKKVRLSYYDKGLRIVRSGYAIPTGLDEGASINSLATYSLSFVGSGALVKVPWSEYEQMELDSVLNKVGYIFHGGWCEVGPSVGDISVYRLSMAAQFRLLIDTHGNDVVLYKSSEPIAPHIKVFDNEWLKQHQIGIVNTENPDMNAQMLMSSGTYYVALGGNAHYSWFSAPEIRTLSLPVT